MISYWEKTALLQKDIVIIGCGITGVLTAIELKKRFPKKDICILERGILPIGATTRNAGFACFGSLSELYNDFQNEGDDKVLSLVEQRFKGLQKLLQITGKKAIHYESFGGYDVINPNHIDAYKNLEWVNEKLYCIFKKTIFFDVSSKIGYFGFNKNIVKHLVYNPLEGQVHSGFLMKQLQKIARQKEVEIVTGALVKQIEKDGDEEQIIIENETWRESIIFRANQVVICNNAFASSLIPELKLKGTFHYDAGFIYFRNIENRILLGGARNIFLESETTFDIQSSSEVISYLNKFLKEIILNGQEVNVTDTWAGIMGFGNTKLPIIKSIRPTLHVAVKFSGMGVALAANAAEKVCDLIS